MNSTSIIIQTALRPMSVVRISGTDFTRTEVADFGEFFAAMATVKDLSNTTLYFNRGPGSYSGIRTGLAYVYGLLHGKAITMDQVVPYTSFDLLRSATAHEGAIYLKSWPRIASGILKNSKGYFSPQVNSHQFITWEEIAQKPNILAITEEPISEENEYRQYAEILKDPVGYRELINRVEQPEKIFEPLYINPVHIT